MNNPTENRTYSAGEFAHSRGRTTKGEAESIKRSAREYAREGSLTFNSLINGIETELGELRSMETHSMLENRGRDVIYFAQIIRTLATLLIKRAEFHAIPKTLADLCPSPKQEPSSGDAA